MASHFERWEKDPFFPAAEEVQESADRMESTYRTLVHAMKEPSAWKTEELRRDLRTALGTAKWQLEEFARAVELSYSKSSSNDAKTRHREFICAMESLISKVEKGLSESSAATGKPPRPWVRLNEGESEELASFLSGSKASHARKQPAEISLNDDQQQKHNVHENKFSGHRRTASAGADLCSWNVMVSDDGKPEQPPRKIPSFSGFLNAMESAPWSKNGYRKLKIMDHRHEADTKLPETQPGINTCYERTKSCLDNGEDCYQKELYGWSGAIQRQLQRSQYYVQYSRPTQMLFLALVLIFVFAIVTVHVI